MAVTRGTREEEKKNTPALERTNESTKDIYHMEIAKRDTTYSGDWFNIFALNSPKKMNRFVFAPSLTFIIEFTYFVCT